MCKYFAPIFGLQYTIINILLSGKSNEAKNYTQLAFDTMNQQITGTNTYDNSEFDVFCEKPGK